MTSIPGVDYAWSHPGGAALKAAGKAFAARYLSVDPKKNISRSEADDLAAHGVSSVVVWESTAKRPLSGRAAGISDAQAAVKQAAAAGMPASRPVYFAVDFDATAGQMPAVMAYLDGAASVLGRERTGVYGGIDVVKAALDGGHVRWAWQTRAWSEGHWDPRAHIRQGATQTIGGVSCDLNTAMTTDYGQWMPGQTPQPTQEDSMPTAAEVAKAVWDHQEVNRASGKPMRMAVGITWADYERQQAVRSLTAQIGALTATVTALAKAVGAAGGLTAEQVTAAAAAGANEALAKLGEALTN
jgi:hypothetical protein